MTVRPFFSIVVTAYNRRDDVLRCARSCLEQTFPSLELIIVDDASTDDTIHAVSGLHDPRIVLRRHAENRGICPARNTGVEAASGEWVLTVDSDWTLEPHALARFFDGAQAAPSDVGALGARLAWDVGIVTPRFVPTGPIDYEGRIRWVEEEGGSDHLFCARRSTFSSVSWSSTRRGGMEALYQLDFCLQFRQMFLDEVLGHQFTDAPNSHSRGRGGTAIASLLRNAADVADQCDELIQRHGAALDRLAPRIRYHFLRKGALNRALAGDMGQARRQLVRCLRESPLDPVAWGALLASPFGPHALARGQLLLRRYSDVRAGAHGGPGDAASTSGRS